MDIAQMLILLGIGLFAGLVSALMGVGGGIVVVPLLTLFLGMTQKTASATSLAMLLPPIGVFAVWEYYQKGLIDVRAAAILAVPFAVGALLGAKFVMPYISEGWLRPMFSSLLIYAAAMTVLKGPGRERAVILAGVSSLGWWVALSFLRMLGKRWEKKRERLQESYLNALTRPRDEVGAGI